MANKSRRNRSKQQKRSRNQQQNRRSRRLNLLGGGDSVSLLYIRGREVPDIYELILVADNFNDLLLQARDVSENMGSSFKEEVNNHMYIQTALLNRDMNTSKISKLSSKAMMNAEGDLISSEDRSTLYYTTDSFGLVTAIYDNREDIERAFPDADIKSIKKNKFDWNHPLFR